MRLLTACFLCLFSLCYAENILVELDTEDPRLPVYAYIDKESASLPNSYLSQIEHILRFDLCHNGDTICLSNSPEFDALANEHAFNDPWWKQTNAVYVIALHIEKQTLTAHVGDVQGSWKKTLGPINLSGNLESDRKQIHAIADTFYKAAFNTSGIANTRILYTLREEDPTKEKGNYVSSIWESDYDGANPRKISDNGYCVTPAYVPPKPGSQSNSIIYVSYVTGTPKIYLESIKQKNPQRLNMIRGNQLMPTISRQRNMAAFISDATGNPDLFLLSYSPENGSDGKPFQAFKTNRATQASPTFSPDGKKLALVSNKDGNARIYVLDITEAAPGKPIEKAKLISRYCKENSAPSWSPDGSKIAYCGMVNGARQIWVYDIVKDKETQITDGKEHKENPSWAPNSKMLVYNTSTNERGELYLVSINHPDPTRIPLGEGQKRFPAWEPR